MPKLFVGLKNHKQKYYLLIYRQKKKTLLVDRKNMAYKTRKRLTRESNRQILPLYI